MKGGSAGIQIKTDDTFLLASTVPALLTSDFQINGKELNSPPDQVSKQSQPEIFFFFFTLIQAKLQHHTKTKEAQQGRASQ